MTKMKNNQKARSPPFKKQTPTNSPELKEIWKNMYNELINEYPKSRALDIIGKKYGVSGTTVRYHLFPERKEYQKKAPSKKWSYEKEDPVIHKKRTDYKAQYMAARRHIDELILESYQRSAPKGTMPLEDLAYAIHDISSIFFKPETILGLAKRYEESKRIPLLIEIPGHDVPRYALSEYLRR